MKYIYEFDRWDEDDMEERKFVELSRSFYDTLSDIAEYLKGEDKGWTDDNKEKIIETIQEILANSKYYEIN